MLQFPRQQMHAYNKQYVLAEWEHRMQWPKHVTRHSRDHRAKPGRHVISQTGPGEPCTSLCSQQTYPLYIYIILNTAPHQMETSGFHLA